MKKIVSVKFDDGTELEVPDVDALRRYIDAYIFQASMRKLAADQSIDWPAVSKAADERQTTKLTKRKTKKETNTRSAKALRKGVTKDQLLEFQKTFNSDYPDAKRGWKKAATHHFSITSKTLNARLKE